MVSGGITTQEILLAESPAGRVRRDILISENPCIVRYQCSAQKLVNELTLLPLFFFPKINYKYVTSYQSI
jgi:hypothetical protein